MSEDMVRPVVLGVDGSSSAVAAVEVAAQEAAALGVGLRIVHAYVWPLFYASLANVPYRAEDWQPGPESLAMVEAMARRTRANHPDLAVETAVTAGGGGAVLVEESTRASLVVLGGRGVGGVAGLLAGPVARYVAARAHCPVIVARDGQRRAPTDAPVVVGLDGSIGARDVLSFARTWAARRGVDVEAMDTKLLPDHEAADALVRASRSARMVVVGSGGHGKADGHLGLVAETLIRSAWSPVTVVPEAYVAIGIGGRT